VGYDIAILGAGFSGTMLAAYLVREAKSPLRIALIDPAPHVPKGAAYSTPRVEHLLNVRANQMGAFPDAADGFWQWLNGRAEPHAFVPRCWYGEYLAMIYTETLELANTRGFAFDVLHWEAESIEARGKAYRIAAASGKAIAAKQLVLATGNQLLPEDSEGIVRIPWAYDYATLPTSPSAPIWIIGSGLTAVDTLMSLTHAGYKGAVRMISRHGELPQAHTALPFPIPNFDPALIQGKTVANAMHLWRNWAKMQIAQGTPWQATIDALRPHTQKLWHDFDDAARARFFRHLWSCWNRHRHRMARDIADHVEHLKINSALEVQAGTVTTLYPGKVTWQDVHGTRQEHDASLIFDCRGPRYRADAVSCLAPLLAEGVAHPSPTGYGLRAFAPYRVSATTFPPLYAIGPLLLGELLETTAIPELRIQARDVAQLLLTRLNAPH
jgi:uncharacterized NAD(P)/FAD-binding protein YdhS